MLTPLIVANRHGMFMLGLLVLLALLVSACGRQVLSASQEPSGNSSTTQPAAKADMPDGFGPVEIVLYDHGKRVVPKGSQAQLEALQDACERVLRTISERPLSPGAVTPEQATANGWVVELRYDAQVPNQRELGYLHAYTFIIRPHRFLIDLSPNSYKVWYYQWFGSAGSEKMHEEVYGGGRDQVVSRAGHEAIVSALRACGVSHLPESPQPTTRPGTWVSASLSPVSSGSGGESGVEIIVYHDGEAIAPHGTKAQLEALRQACDSALWEIHGDGLAVDSSEPRNVTPRGWTIELRYLAPLDPHGVRLPLRLSPWTGDSFLLKLQPDAGRVWWYAGLYPTASEDMGPGGDPKYSGELGSPRGLMRTEGGVQKIVDALKECGIVVH